MSLAAAASDFGAGTGGAGGPRPVCERPAASRQRSHAQRTALRCCSKKLCAVPAFSSCPR